MRVELMTTPSFAYAGHPRRFEAPAKSLVAINSLQAIPATGEWGAVLSQSMADSVCSESTVYKLQMQLT